MKVHILTSIIEIREANPYILVSKKLATELKKEWKKPMPVLIRVNGEPAHWWKINMMPAGDGAFYLYLHGEVRKASETKVGDQVRVEIKFDETYKNGPQHPLPTWLAEALKKNKKAEKNWNNLIPSRQKEILRYLATLKSEEAKMRNMKKALIMLSGEAGRFMARTWKEGK